MCCSVSPSASTPYTVPCSSSLYNDDISVYFPSQLFPRNNFAILTVLDACNPTPFKWFATIFSNQAECIKRIIFSAKIVPQFGGILTLQLTGNFSNLRNLGRTCVHVCCVHTSKSKGIDLDIRHFFFIEVYSLKSSWFVVRTFSIVAHAHCTTCPALPQLPLSKTHTEIVHI